MFSVKPKCCGLHCRKHLNEGSGCVIQGVRGNDKISQQPSQNNGLKPPVLVYQAMGKHSVAFGQLRSAHTQL